MKQPPNMVEVYENLKTHAKIPVEINFKGKHPRRMGFAVIDIEKNELLVGPYKFHLTPDRQNKHVTPPPGVSSSGLVTPNGMPVMEQTGANQPEAKKEDGGDNGNND